VGGGSPLIVPDPDGWHFRLAADGLPVTALEDQPWGMREFTLTDPSGNNVRIGHSAVPRRPISAFCVQGRATGPSNRNEVGDLPTFFFAGSGFVGRWLAFGVELDQQPVWVFELDEPAEVPFGDRRMFDAALVEIYQPVQEIVGVFHRQRDR
jgi:hypothetical protein